MINPVPKNELLIKNDLPYILFALIGAAVMLFFLPFVVVNPHPDYLSAVIFSICISLQLLSIWMYRFYSQFLAMLLVVTVQNFDIFWISYHFGLSTGVLLFYFPYLLAYLYFFLYNSGTLKIIIKLSVALLFFILTITLSEKKAANYTFLTDIEMNGIFFFNCFFAILATLIILYSIYRQFMYMNTQMLIQQKKEHLVTLREIDLQHEISEYSLLLSLRDDVAQSLAGCRMFLQMVKDKPQPVQKADEELKLTIDKLNAISFDLSPAMLIDLGLENGMTVYAEQLSKKYNTPIAIEMGKQSHDLPDIDRLSFFRILHQCVCIIAEEKTGPLTIRVRFNGKVWIQFTYSPANKNFSELLKQSANKDLTKRFDYYNAIINEQPGQLELILDFESK